MNRILSVSPVKIMVVILLASFALMLNASLRESAITDEVAHIPAGYSYVRYLDYRLNPEHPPLLKALSGLPLLALNPYFPTESSQWQNDVNSQWVVGGKFLYSIYRQADELIRLARLAPILLTLFTSYFIYRWGKEFLGERWALLPTFLFALSPTILSHGHYVTTDIAAAFGVVFSTYYLIRYLREPSGKNMLIAGLAFGVAQLAKFSTFLLIPYFLGLAVLFVVARIISNKYRGGIFTFGYALSQLLKSIAGVLAIFVIGYVLIVYPVYLVFTANYPIAKQISDTESILTSFSGGPTPQGASCRLMRCPADLDIWLSKNPITRPFAYYLLGILMVFQRAAGGNTSYFLGEVSAAGSHYYFPVVYVLKETLPALLLVLTALFFGIRGALRGLIKPEFWKRVSTFFYENFLEISMFLFVLLYWTNSIVSPLNIGLRHLIPTFPFIYMLTAVAWKRNFFGRERLRAAIASADMRTVAGKIMASSIAAGILAILLLWSFGETLAATPYYLSYFNQFGGGVKNGYRFVTDSNYDWGQDLLRLRDWVKSNPEVDKIAVDYFGGGNPKYYLQDKEEDWWSSKGNPANSGIHYLAISVNSLQGAIQPAAAGFERKPEDEYRWLTSMRPPMPGMGNIPQWDYRIGTSIFIYKI